MSRRHRYRGPAAVAGTPPAAPTITLLPDPDRPDKEVELEVFDVTPDMARHWLGHYAYPGQRPLRRHRVEELAGYMRGGEFTLSQVVIGHVGPHGYILDGQHRLQAVVASDLAQRMIVQRRILPDLDALAAVYATFDRPLVRSYRDAFRAAGTADRVGLTDRAVGAVSAAAAFLDAGFLPQALAHRLDLRSPGKRRALVEEWGPAGRDYTDFLRGAPRAMAARLLATPICSVALVTCRYQRTAAADFWPALAENDRLHAGMPAHTLHRYVLENRVLAGTQAKYARAVAAAWNAHYEARRTVLLRVLDPGSPIVIKGTPFTGNTGNTKPLDRPPAAD